MKYGRNSGRWNRSVLWALMAFAVLVAADQLSKYAACIYLKPLKYIDVMPGIFQLYYLENTGAAFGMLDDRQVFFIAAALVMTVLIAVIYGRIPGQRRYRPLRCICVILAAGAVGNMIDRMARGYVVDFLYVSLIDFPVFNIADCYVCIGVALLIILLFTSYREEPFDFLLPSKKI